MVSILLIIVKVFLGILLALIAIIVVRDSIWYIKAQHYKKQGFALRYFPALGFMGYAETPGAPDGLVRYRALYHKPNDPTKSEPAIVINGVGIEPMIMLSDKDLIKEYHKVESEVSYSQNLGNFPFDKAFIFLKSKKAIMNRGIFAEIFYPDNLRKQAPTIKALMDRHMTHLRMKVEAEGVDGIAEVELRDYVNAIFSDVVAFILFGDEIPKIEGVKLTDQIEKNFNDYFALNLSFRNIITSGYGNKLFPSAEYKETVRMHQKIQEVLRESVKKRRDSGSYVGGTNAVDLLIAHNAKKEAEGKVWETLSMQEIIDNIYLVIFAGMDTSKNLTQNCLTILSKSPHLQKPLREELMAKIFDQNLGESYDAYDSSEMLTRFITEALRLYSPAWLGNIHKVTKSFQLGDYHIKKGTVIMLSIVTLQSKPEYFENPLKFDIERYKKNKNIKELSRHALIPFSAGKRACIGRNMAEIVVKMIVSSVLSQFELTASEVKNSRFGKPNYTLEHCRAKVRCLDCNLNH